MGRHRKIESLYDQLYHQRLLAAHKKRLRNPRSKVDCNAPVVQATRTINMTHLFQDGLHRFKVLQKNQSTFAKLYFITLSRYHGRADKHEKPLTSMRNRHEATRRRIRQLEKDNFKFGNMLLKTKSRVDTWLKPPKKEKCEKEFEVPEEILKKYKTFPIPKSVPYLCKLLRPQIYFDLLVRKVRHFGRFVVQLYTEAAPDVVLELVRLCAQQQSQRLNFKRLFPNLWMEAVIPLSTDSALIQRPVEYDTRALSHSNSSGILSFSRQQCCDSSLKRLSIAISFRPLNILSTYRVAFGRIIDGRKKFERLIDHGSKNGKPKTEIEVTQCGLV